MCAQQDNHRMQDHMLSVALTEVNSPFGGVGCVHGLPGAPIHSWDSFVKAAGLPTGPHTLCMVAEGDPFQQLDSQLFLVVLIWRLGYSSFTSFSSAVAEM